MSLVVLIVKPAQVHLNKNAWAVIKIVKLHYIHRILVYVQLNAMMVIFKIKISVFYAHLSVLPVMVGHSNNAWAVHPIII